VTLTTSNARQRWEPIFPSSSRNLREHGDLTPSPTGKTENNMGFAILVGLLFLASGVGCLLWPADFWRSEMRRHRPENPDEVKPTRFALLDMQLRGVLCLVVGVALITGVIWRYVEN
jgi:hypothetical protein